MDFPREGKRGSSNAGFSATLSQLAVIVDGTEDNVIKLKEEMKQDAGITISNLS